MKSIIKLGFLSVLLLSQAAMAQICSDSIKPSWPDTRYILQGSEVLDKATQLIWKRCSEGQAWDENAAVCRGEATIYTWPEALALSDATWRVPNIKELLSIIEMSCDEPSLNISAFFPSYFSNNYWSSSPSAEDSNSAWFVYFSSSFNSSIENKDRDFSVRLVRSAQ